MAGSLVLISIDDPGAGCLLALGTFVGDAMYANTAEAATRYQAAHDDFFSGVDSNAILAPVYITTTLLRDEPVNVQTLLAEAPDLQHKRADIAALIGTHSANLCLPPPLCLLLPELQIAFKAPMADHGTRADHENLICRAFWNLCIHEARVRPDRVIMPKSGDDDRVAAVMQLDNALHHGVGGQMPPPKKRCKSPRPSTCNKKHAIKNLMQLAASRIQTFMAHEFNAEHRALSSLL